MYLTALKILAPVVLFVGYTWLVYDHAAGVEQLKCKQAQAEGAKQARQTEQKLIQKSSEVDNDGVEKIRQLSIDADSLRSERDRLQQLYTDSIRRLPKNAPPTCNCNAASARADLHAQLYAESIRANEKLAAEADAYRVAGEACQAVYH